MSLRTNLIPLWETIETLVADLESKQDSDKIEVEVLTLRIILKCLLNLRESCRRWLP